jgi:hypothetical protein
MLSEIMKQSMKMEMLPLAISPQGTTPEQLEFSNSVMPDELKRDLAHPDS